MSQTAAFRVLLGSTLALLLAACGGSPVVSEANPYANGADYPWTYTRPDTQFGAQALTPGDNTLFYEPILSATNGWGPLEINRSNGEQQAGDGKALTLNGVTYKKGLGVHAGSDVRYSLLGSGASCVRFTADIGVDDEVGSQGSVVFQVYLDGVKAYDSGTMTGSSATKKPSLDISGKQELRLVVTDAGNGKDFDHADWATPKITCVAVPITGGRLDPSFDSDGIVALPITSLSDFSRAFSEVVQQADGRLVAVTQGGAYRYTAAGQLDRTFGVGGRAGPDAPAATLFFVGLQPDQGVLVGGFQYRDNTGSAWFVQRLRPSGALDLGFGTGGSVVLGANERLQELAVQPDGRFLTASILSTSVTGLPLQLMVRRYAPGGQPDATFGVGGQVAVPLSGGGAVIQSSTVGELLTLPGGAVLVSNTLRNGTNFVSTAELIRLLPGGGLDASFDGDGRWQLPSVELLDVAAGPAGDLLVGGIAERSSAAGRVREATLLRLRADGSRAPGFGTAGQLIFPAYTSADALAVQGDGRILVGLEVVAELRTDLARLLPAGGFDGSFGTAGTVRLPRPRMVFGDTLVQTEGRIVLGGGEIDVSANLFRLLP